jgi:hypothetical protein
MSVRHGHAQALAAWAAAISPGHIGAGPALIDEHQAVGIEVELCFEPSFALGQDVRALLLGRVAGLFLCV